MTETDNSFGNSTTQLLASYVRDVASNSSISVTSCLKLLAAAERLESFDGASPAAVGTGTRERKIVHLAALPESINHAAALYALAGDGTLWMSVRDGNDPLCEDDRWEQIPALPCVASSDAVSGSEE